MPGRIKIRPFLGIIGILCLSIHLLFPETAFAWSKSGHSAIALLAERRLSPQVLQKIRSILGRNVSMAEIASCADGDSAPQCGSTFNGAALRKDWHTLSIPVEDSPSQDSLERYCRGDCVTDKINENLKILENKNIPLDTKRIALIYLVHFVGDLHQPLHCVVARLDDGSPDRWAIKSQITFMGWKGSLHWLWDNVIETPAIEEARNPRDLAEKLESDMKGKDVKAWTEGNVVSLAALESFQLSKETILPDHRKNGDRERGDQYRQQMLPIALTRLEEAGIRLALLLDNALGAEATPPKYDRRQAAAKEKVQGLLDSARQLQ